MAGVLACEPLLPLPSYKLLICQSVTESKPFWHQILRAL